MITAIDEHRGWDQDCQAMRGHIERHDRGGNPLLAAGSGLVDQCIDDRGEVIAERS